MVTRPVAKGKDTPAAPVELKNDPAPSKQPLGSPSSPGTNKQGTPSSLDFSNFQFSSISADFQVDVDVDPVDSAAEEVAILYANGQDGEAKAVLEYSVKLHHAGSAERLWLMLFDFYKQTGNKAGFEGLEIDFARCFEKSPPTWVNKAKSQPAAKIAPTGTAIFKGDLIGSNEAGFALVRQSIEKAPTFRLDLSQIKQVDASGCGTLLALLHASRKKGAGIELLGREVLGALVEAKVESGRADNQECWLLLLEICQLQGQQEAFEEVAINFAITFELSPPSFEAKRIAAAEPVMETPLPVISTDDNFPLKGEIRSFRFADLPAFAETHNPVVIECGELTRIDFVSAGALLNVLTNVKRSGKQIVFRHPNHLVAELLGVVGLKAVAHIVMARS